MKSALMIFKPISLRRNRSRLTEFAEDIATKARDMVDQHDELIA